MRADVLPERVRIGRASVITGLSRRTLQDMAARGKLPGAAKLGSHWTFDLARLRHWIREREAETWETTSTGGERSGGADLRFEDANIDALYEQLLAGKL